MSGFLISVLCVCGAVVSGWLAFVPWNILKELRRQGEVREQNDLKIIGLLVGIQAALDERAKTE